MHNIILYYPCPKAAPLGRVVASLEFPPTSFVSGNGGMGSGELPKGAGRSSEPDIGGARSFQIYSNRLCSADCLLPKRTTRSLSQPSEGPVSREASSAVSYLLLQPRYSKL